MATRSQRTQRLAPELRRAQLLDAALAVLNEQGFGAVTVEAVAQRAGVTRPVVYDVFGDLEGLMLALIDDAERTALDPLLAIVEANPGDDVDPEQFLFDSVLAFLEAVKRDPRTWRLVLMPPRGSSRELQERIRRSRRLVADRVTTLLDWGVPRRGGPRGLDHELAARVIVAAGEDAARLMLAHPRRFTPERMTAVARDFIALLPSDAVPRGNPVPALRINAPREPAPPGPRRRLPQSERREQLLDVALELLGEEGFASISMEAIARRANVNRAVLYRSFANIHVLLAALLHREDRRIRRTIDELLPDDPGRVSPAQLLGDSLARFLSGVMEQPATWRMALLRPESAPIALQKLVNRRRAAIAKRLEPLIRWGIARLHSDPSELDLEAFSRMLLSVCEEAARLVLDDPDFTPERVMRGSWVLLEALPAT